MVRFETLMKIMKKYNIPSDVKILSHPGRRIENRANHVNVVFYNREKNILSLEQEMWDDDFLTNMLTLDYEEDSRSGKDTGEELISNDWEMVYNESEKGRYRDLEPVSRINKPYFDHDPFDISGYLEAIDLEMAKKNMRF